MPDAINAMAREGRIRRSGCHASPTRLMKMAIAERKPATVSDDRLPELS
jgi:hypothetical protein